MTTKLQAIFAAFVETLRFKLSEAWDDILRQITETVEQAQDEGTSAKFKAGFSMTYDMDAGKLDADLSYGVRKHWKHTQEAPDPNQEKLPLDGSVTITTPGRELVAVTAEKFQRVTKKRGGE